MSSCEFDPQDSTSHAAARKLNAELAGADVAAELRRLTSSIGEFAELTRMSVELTGQGSTLAWLRRVTHDVDILRARWLEVLPAQKLASACRRREDVR